MNELKYDDKHVCYTSETYISAKEWKADHLGYGKIHGSVQSKFVFGGSRLLDLKPYILLGAKFKEHYMIATGLFLTGWTVLDLSGEDFWPKMLLGKFSVMRKKCNRKTGKHSQNERKEKQSISHILREVCSRTKPDTHIHKNQECWVTEWP